MNAAAPGVRCDGSAGGCGISSSAEAVAPRGMPDRRRFPRCSHRWPRTAAREQGPGYRRNHRRRHGLIRCQRRQFHVSRHLDGTARQRLESHHPVPAIMRRRGRRRSGLDWRRDPDPQHRRTDGASLADARRKPCAARPRRCQWWRPVEKRHRAHRHRDGAHLTTGAPQLPRSSASSTSTSCAISKRRYSMAQIWAMWKIKTLAHGSLGARRTIRRCRGAWSSITR